MLLPAQLQEAFWGESGAYNIDCAQFFQIREQRDYRVMGTVCSKDDGVNRAKLG